MTSNRLHPMRIGIQGVQASFHDVAARKHFGSREISLIECPSFRSLSDCLSEGRADLCLMAIENAIAGSILPNYSLMEAYGFKIIGEVYLRIELHLMALPGQELSDITTVRSHPMALAQCDEFFAAHPLLKAIEAADTAESARDIAAQKLRGTAVIASRLAAETYGLTLLREGIESNRRNYTRFLVICRGPDYQRAGNANKASIRFEVADRPGCLARVLQVFNLLSVNMTKIQSVPIPGRPYEYSFHVDLEWSDDSRYAIAMENISKEVINLIHFGEYPRGERP